MHFTGCVALTSSSKLIAIVPTAAQGTDHATERTIRACYEGWDYVADCSQRTCEKGVARFEGATAANVAHGSTGPCRGAQMQASATGPLGFAIAWCRIQAKFARGRTVSSDGSVCSGHGECMSMYHLGKHYGVDTTPGVVGDGVGPLYTNWEADILRLLLRLGLGRL